MLLGIQSFPDVWFLHVKLKKWFTTENNMEKQGVFADILGIIASVWITFVVGLLESTNFREREQSLVIRVVRHVNHVPPADFGC